VTIPKKMKEEGFTVSNVSVYGHWALLFLGHGEASIRTDLFTPCRGKGEGWD
jgi:hypothetical protein